LVKPDQRRVEMVNENAVVAADKAISVQALGEDEFGLHG
jgi:hypothetical protein